MWGEQSSTPPLLLTGNRHRTAPAAAPGPNYTPLILLCCTMILQRRPLFLSIEEGPVLICVEVRECC